MVKVCTVTEGNRRAAQYVHCRASQRVELRWEPMNFSCTGACRVEQCSLTVPSSPGVEMQQEA